MGLGSRLWPVMWSSWSLVMSDKYFSAISLSTLLYLKIEKTNNATPLPIYTPFTTKSYLILLGCLFTIVAKYIVVGNVQKKTVQEIFCIDYANSNFFLSVISPMYRVSFLRTSWHSLSLNSDSLYSSIYFCSFSAGCRTTAFFQSNSSGDCQSLCRF